MAFPNIDVPAEDFPDAQLSAAEKIARPITMHCLGVAFRLRIERDLVRGINGRIFLQVVYDDPCTKTDQTQEWHGRKWYLSDHMTADEIVKTAYAAFEATVKHEVMEGFKVDDQILFNPHVHFRSLLAITDQEVGRPVQQ
ncbi:hypothetical protein [Fibrella forsythiae]|uniref:Uncharacterized protein n=1 Tax=Fibrella forsythiae TaxID=2817061 RepID=A0ABS3JC46_9BACT|nr:hypothetical protein [Fibrella forsythiae]MBO0947550.1 hypothetical protein [Fibrella forsythiae]